MIKLPASFYTCDSITLAENLLGKILYHQTPEGLTGGRIVETEAYMGAIDAGAHSFQNRRTPRTEVLFSPGGISYVYLIYGMYHCVNVTANIPEKPEAVLIRALEPLYGIPLMQQRRSTEVLKNLCSGPGKLCKALNIDKTCNGLPFTGDTLYITEDTNPISFTVQTAKRINIDYAGEAKEYLWRFLIKDSPFISVKPKP